MWKYRTTIENNIKLKIVITGGVMEILTHFFCKYSSLLIKSYNQKLTATCGAFLAAQATSEPGLNGMGGGAITM